MFVIDKERGERPICRECHKPFPATPKQVEAFRRTYPRIAVVCPACIVRECGKAAYCRGCTGDVELARQIREVRAENPGIAAAELAYKIKDRAELKRLTARVRRVLQEAVA